MNNLLLHFLILKFQYIFSLFLQNIRFFALPIPIHSFLVSLNNSYWVSLETTLDK